MHSGNTHVQVETVPCLSLVQVAEAVIPSNGPANMSSCVGVLSPIGINSVTIQEIFLFSIPFLFSI